MNQSTVRFLEELAFLKNKLKKILVQKSFGVQNICVQKKFLDTKKFLIKKKFAVKIVQVTKMLSPRNDLV